MARAIHAGVVCAVLLGAVAASAHKPSDSYLTFDVRATRIAVRWDIALRDLDYALGLDGDGDGAITWAELRARHHDIAQYALSRLSVDGCSADAARVTQLVVDHSDGAYDVLELELHCAAAPTVLVIDYRLLFDLDPQHHGLARFVGARGRSLVFTAERTRQTITVGRQDGWRQLGAYVRLGVHHIWSGVDHILFLLALLLPAVLRRERRGWSAVSGLRPALIDVLRIVTAFTVAHSLTLSLAALNLVRLPSRFVESAIAATVALAALNNLLPLVGYDRWLVAFALGLLHGFGFSATLIDLGLPRHELVFALFGFNVGVELGQLCIVAAFVPLAFMGRRSVFYRRGVTVASVAIVIVALVWLVERAFALPAWPR